MERPSSKPPLSCLVALLLLAGAVAAPLEAQETGRITGRVVMSGTQRPLIGAQVFIPGTEFGGPTNNNGNFLFLNVPAGAATVRVVMVGFAPVERQVSVPAGGTATLEIEMRETAIALDEVVVTGAGQATEKRRLGNTIATINTDRLSDAPTRNVAEVLQGREPGVIAQGTGGMAGEGSQIRIRGSASLSQSNEPIIYIDGVRADNSVGYGGVGATSRLNDLNPDAIERVEILKGAAAATLYGTEASNGVIQIFTKQGSAGEPRWEVSVEQGFSRYDLGRIEKHAGFATTQEQADRAAAYWGLGSLAPYEVFEVELMPMLFETGRHQTYSLSVSGGSDAVQYYVSGRLADENGPYGARDWGPAADVDDKKQANANITLYPRQNLRLRLNSMYTEGYHEVPSNGNDIFGGFSLAIMSKPELAHEGNPTGAAAFTTVRETMHIVTGEDIERFAGGLNASYSPTPEINIDATFGLDVGNRRGYSFKPFGWNVDGVSNDNVQGEREVDDRNRRQVTFDARGSWDARINESFTSSLVVGAQTLVSRTQTSTVTGRQFPAPGLEVAEAGTEQEVGETYLATVNTGLSAQEQIGFKNVLFTTVGMRFDKHSAFGESAGGAVYPKVSLSFVASDLPGWDSELLSTLRLRAALGTAGLQPGAFDKYTTYDPLASETGPGVEPDNLGNADLKPEVSTEFEAGAELGILNNRAAVNFTYWNRKVEDVLVARQFAPSGGFLNTQLDNIGAMEAWGLEIGVNGNILDRRNLTIDLFANGSFIRETVTDMGGAPPLKIGYYRYRTWIREGYAPGAYFGPKLVDAPYPFDTNGDGQPDSEAEILAFLSTPRSPDAISVMGAPAEDGDILGHYLGKPVPDWSGSFGLDIGFLRNFRLSSQFEYKAGNFVVHNLSGAFRQAHSLLGRNTRTAAEVEAVLRNPASTAEERLAAAQVWARELKALSPLDGLNEIEPGDYLRWRELSLTYQVPPNLIARFGAERLSLTASGRNLMLWTKYNGIDPESNVLAQDNFIYGIDGWRPGLPRRFSFTARVGF